jgi:hypothetical protein
VATKRSQDAAWEAKVAVVRDGSVLITCGALVVVHRATDAHWEPRRCAPDGRTQGRAFTTEEAMTPAVARPQRLPRCSRPLAPAIARVSRALARR